MVEGKRGTGYVLSKIGVYGSLALVSLICVLPFWHVLMESFSDPLYLLANNDFLWLPLRSREGRFSLEAYQIIFGYNRIWRAYLNTIIYTSTSTALGLFIATMAAYVLSRRDLLFKKPLMIFFLITLFFSGGMIPYFIVVHALGLANTPFALIIPGCCNAFSIILIKNGMDSLPNDYYEAARMDGAGHFWVFARVVLPLIVPFLTVTAMFAAIGNWNSWVAASYFINNRHAELYPLQLLLRNILIRSDVPGIIRPGSYPLSFYLKSIKAGAIIVASLPLLAIYPFIQKHFERGIVLGGVKG
jgi:putative aldouronate transport system permease protein